MTALSTSNSHPRCRISSRWLASGLIFSETVRHTGRLVRFVDDTPSGHFLFSLTDVDGELYAGNKEGIYHYTSIGWKLVLPGIVNALLGEARSTSTPEDIYNVDRGECGSISVG